jgi:hypothetical protein
MLMMYIIKFITPRYIIESQTKKASEKISIRKTTHFRGSIVWKPLIHTIIAIEN